MTLADTGFALMQPDGLWWFLVAGLAIAAILWLLAWRRRARQALADAALLTEIAPRVLGARAGVRAALVAAAALLLAVALLDPRMGGRTEKVEQTGIDVMVVVDVSRSMLAEDAQPDRLSRAKQFAADLVDALGSDRVGLIEFAGVPALRCPLTFNHRAFLTQLETLTPQATVRGGSLLGDAIRLASSCLAGEGVGKVVIVLSDGEDMESAPVEAAATAATENGIRIVTVGIGDSSEGARIPTSTGNQKRYLVHDGQEVWTKMDPTLLAEVARAGDGFFIEAGTGQADMAQAAALLRRGLTSKARTQASVTTKEPLFQYLAGAALLLLVLEGLVGSRLERRAAGVSS
ncbi:MAG: VWA domain-containing protein [Planctomycetaceae bacterium]|nr:VWA domain-containing protein [Planctomycetaceae bacterium]